MDIPIENLTYKERDLITKIIIKMLEKFAMIMILNKKMLPLSGGSIFCGWERVSPASKQLIIHNIASYCLRK
jgi:hypothetical protein